KLNHDNVGCHFTSRGEIEIDKLGKPIILDIPSPELRFQGSLISASNITFPYPHSATKVLKDVSPMIHPGDRAGLVGKDWEGKPTLVKLLTGTGELVPKKGSIERHPRLRLGYFDQHSVEALTSTEVASTSAVRYFLDTLQSASLSIDVDESAARACLGSFGLHGRTAVNPISTLSGGQKVRLALAIVVYPASNLLVPDEVATYLDKDTIVALIQALRKHTGAVLLVSHDRHFVRCVIESEHAVPRLGDSDGESDEGSDEDDDTGQSGKGTVYAVGPKGRLKPLSGGMDDYAVVIEKQMRKLGLA
ncbi:P-loop containing nucleoside triphosphate hydrolase protein, partial [Cyathus striatus]